MCLANKWWTGYSVESEWPRSRRQNRGGNYFFFFFAFAAFFVAKTLTPLRIIPIVSCVLSHRVNQHILKRLECVRPDLSESLIAFQ